MDQALADMRVLDLTHHIAGPFCTRLLGDYGADVIKIEKPGEGDPARRIGPFPGDIPHPEKSGVFLHLNTNKRSVTLDLKTTTGQDIFKALVKDVDVVVESFRPGVMASFGLDYPALEAIKPDLVMASISNFGQTGPYRDFKASDLVLSMMGGNTGAQPGRRPLKYGGMSRQFQAGLLSLSGILAAFYIARWAGEGQYLDLSIMEMLISSIDRGPAIVGHQLMWEGKPAPPPKMQTTANPYLPAGIYACKDGYVSWFTVPQWGRTARMLGRPDFLTDPRYATVEARLKNTQEIQAIISAWMLERTKRELWDAGIAAGLICAPCNTVEDLWADRHLKERGYWVEIDHPAVGHTYLPGPPFIPKKTPAQLRRTPPLLGEHNAEVLGGLGYSKEDLVKLSQAGVV